MNLKVKQFRVDEDKEFIKFKLFIESDDKDSSDGLIRYGIKIHKSQSDIETYIQIFEIFSRRLRRKYGYENFDFMGPHFEEIKKENIG